MNRKKVDLFFNILLFFCLMSQIIIYQYNQQISHNNVNEKNISIENFSTIILTKSGITKIGSQKLNKIGDNNLFLQDSSYLENQNYKIFGNDIYINLDKEFSYSDKPVKTINSMGEMNANGFKNNDLQGKILFIGTAIFKFDD